MNNEYELWMDKSRWNVIDVGAVDPVVAGYISKSTQGNYRTDATFAGDQVTFPAFGKKRACYHWDDPLCNAASQVDRILQVVGPHLDGQEFLGVDSEQWWSDWVAWNEWRAGRIPKDAVPRLAPNQISDSSQAICERLRFETGMKIAVYTRAWFVKEYAPGMAAWMGNFDHWYAQWPYNSTVITTSWDKFMVNYLPGVDEPAWPAGYADTEWAAWQFTGDKFILPGCSGAIDLNFVKKSFLGEPVTPAPERMVKVKAGLNIRTGPWGQDWGNTDKTVSVPVIGEALDVQGKKWYQVPAWVAGWLVEKMP